VTAASTVHAADRLLRRRVGLMLAAPSNASPEERREEARRLNDRRRAVLDEVRSGSTSWPEEEHALDAALAAMLTDMTL